MGYSLATMAKKQHYKLTTRLVHGPTHSAKWDFSHHVVPPLSSSTTYRLDSAKRGARGFQEFGRLVKDVLHDLTSRMRRAG